MIHHDLAHPDLGCPRVRIAWRSALELNRLEANAGPTARPLQPSPAGRRLGFLAALALALTACVTDNAPESSASLAGASAAEPGLDLMAEAAWPAEYMADPLWVRAGGGDDLDQARLARRESAESLVGAVARGGSLGRVALASLSYASDRRAARGALCALLPRAKEASLGPLLAALLDVVMDAPATEEALDPDADARCAQAVEEVTRRELPTPFDRDRAQVVLSRLRPR
jgi:hypothetical protein